MQCRCFKRASSSSSGQIKSTGLCRPLKEASGWTASVAVPMPPAPQHHARSQTSNLAKRLVEEDDFRQRTSQGLQHMAMQQSGDVLARCKQLNAYLKVRLCIPCSSAVATSCCHSAQLPLQGLASTQQACPKPAVPAVQAALPPAAQPVPVEGDSESNSDSDLQPSSRDSSFSGSDEDSSQAPATPRQPMEGCEREAACRSASSFLSSEDAVQPGWTAASGCEWPWQLHAPGLLSDSRMPAADALRSEQTHGPSECPEHAPSVQAQCSSAFKQSALDQGQDGAGLASQKLSAMVSQASLAGRPPSALPASCSSSRRGSSLVQQAAALTIQSCFRDHLCRRSDLISCSWSLLAHCKMGCRSLTSVLACQITASFGHSKQYTMPCRRHPRLSGGVRVACRPREPCAGWSKPQQRLLSSSRSQSADRMQAVASVPLLQGQPAAHLS